MCPHLCRVRNQTRVSKGRDIARNKASIMIEKNPPNKKKIQEVQICLHLTTWLQNVRRKINRTERKNKETSDHGKF